MIAAIVWTVAAWAFLVLVLLKRWRERERHDAAETEKVLDRLLHDKTNDHIYDGA
jgi:hypothetical protein